MPDRYALVVGISQYARFASLEKAAASALEVAHVLKDQGAYRVEPVPVAAWLDAETPQAMGLELTGRELWRSLATFFLETAKGGDALFYFCGHGFVLRDSNTNKPTGAYLATSDTSVEVNDDGEIVSQRGGISFKSLIDLFAKADLQSLVVILDCCHSGSLLEKDIVETLLATHNKDCPYHLITACRAVESAYEGDSQYTIFTTAFLNALAVQRADEDGRITGGRAWESIERTLAGRIQKPVNIALRGSVTLVKYPPKSAPSQPADLPTPAPIVQRQNPYVGLLAFEEADAPRFFGRDAASWDLLQDLQQTRFLAVVGDSGSGKSSLVKAGLLPKLRQGTAIPGSDQWQIVAMRPGANPAVRLNAFLAQHPDGHPPLLVFIDQFEEVFTLCTDEAEKIAFMQQITQVVQQPDSQTRFVITIRGDFLTRCGEYEIADLINASKPRGYIIKAMTAAELKEAIAQPAANQGVEFEPHLVDQMIREIQGQPGALPLLQHALQRLWQECIEHPDTPQPRLTWQVYEQIGGVAGALNQEADDLYNSLTSAEQDFTRQLFVQQLVRREGLTLTRRRVRQNRLGDSPLLQPILNRFTDKRLLVKGIVETPGAPPQSPPPVFVEIAHEAILEQWTLLKTWLQEDQEKLDLLQQLRTNYDNWNSRYQQSDNALLMGALLANIEEKLDWRSLPEEAPYVQKSLEKRDREVRFYRGATIGAIAATLCITVISIFGAMQWRTADREQIRAQTNFARASFTVNRDTFDALLEALKAGKQLQQSFWFRNDPELRAEVMEVLAQTTNWVREYNRLEGHKNFVWAVSFSPDGQTLATSGEDNVLRLWNADGKEKQVLKDHADRVTGISFSREGKRDGKFLVTCSKDGTIKVRNSRTGQVLKSLKVGKDYRRVRFSPDGTTVAAVSDTGYITLWEWQTSNPAKVRPGHSGVAYDVDFSPDGQLIATAGEDRLIKFWNRQGQPQGSPLSGNTQAVTSIRFSPVEENLASASNDGKLILWNWKRRIQKRRLGENSQGLRDVQFSQDGQELGTAGDDGTINVWSLSGSLITSLKRHQEQVTSFSFSPDGQSLASASADGTVKLWHIHPRITVLNKYEDAVFMVVFKQPNGQLLLTDGERNSIKLWRSDGTFQWSRKESNSVYSIDFSPTEDKIVTTSGNKINLWSTQGKWIKTLGEHNQDVWGVSFSPDGKIVVSTGSDKVVKVWDLSGNLFAPPLQGHTKGVRSARFSPDGQTLATASFDGTVRLWSNKGELRRTLNVFENKVYRVSFSPDSRMIAVGGANSVVKLWKLDGTPLPPLEGHTKGVNDVSFSPNGLLIATASDDGTLKLWSRDSKLFTTLLRQDYPINGLSFSPDNHQLAVASGDKRVLLIDTTDLTVEGLIQRGCRQVQHYKGVDPLCKN